MERKVMDFTPFLRGDEKLLIKQNTKKSNGVFIELAACFTLWLICIALDCFMIGALSQIRTMVKLDNNYYIILIPALFVHIVPFGAWMLSVFKRISPMNDKWYAVTDKRIAVVKGVKPVSVTYLDFTDVTSVLLAANKVTVKFGEEKLVLNGLSDPEAIYDVLINAIFPETTGDETTFDENADLTANTPSSTDSPLPDAATEPIVEPEKEPENESADETQVEKPE